VSRLAKTLRTVPLAMVRLAAPVAINSEDLPSETQLGETAESQEGRIHADYQEALKLQHAGNKTEAQVRILCS